MATKDEAFQQYEKESREATLKARDTLREQLKALPPGVIEGLRNKSKGGIETMKVRYERIYPPSHTDKQDPRCPECGDPMFYVGMRAELNKGDFIEHELYQCCTCRRLFQSKVIPQ